MKEDKIVLRPHEIVSDPSQMTDKKSITAAQNSTIKPNRKKPEQNAKGKPIVGPRWQFLQSSLRRIIEHGIQQGILEAKPGLNSAPLNFFEATKAAKEQDEEAEKAAHTDHFELPVNDHSVIHQAIPFLPLPCAIICLLLNICVPGTGTLLSGIFGLCLGLPRLQVKEGKRAGAFLINTMVGISQFFTVTFLLIGWFWSLAWGGQMLMHALHYRQAMKEKRKAAVATVALEAFTKGMLLRRRDVHKLVQKDKTPKQKQKEAEAAAAAEAEAEAMKHSKEQAARESKKNAAVVELGIKDITNIASSIVLSAANEKSKAIKPGKKLGLKFKKFKENFHAKHKSHDV